MKCRSKTKLGKPCRWNAQKNSDYCKIHSRPETIGNGSEVFWGHLDSEEKEFCREYLTSFNLEQSAIAGGYAGANPYGRGSVIISRTHVRSFLAEAADHLFMSLDEAKKRISEMARASFEPFLIWDENDLGFRLDLTSEKARQNIHLIKKIKQTEKIRTMGEVSLGTRTFDIELHDAKDALDKVFKLRGAYSPERIAIEDNRTSPDAPKTLEEWYDENR